MGEKTILEDMILQEIAGKNAALHAYDSILWKIRSGYLILVFSGWAILLKNLAAESIQEQFTCVIVVSMFLCNLGMSFGGCFIDCNYVRRKFRVILALNDLVKFVKENPDNLDRIPHDFLKNAGDDGSMDYKCKGYTEAVMAGKMVYFVTVFFLAISTLILYHNGIKSFTM